MKEYDGRDDIRFVVVYQREPHARQLAFADVPQPTTREERVELARKALEELKLDVEVWVDDQGDTSRAVFGDLPHSAIVIDPSGAIRLKVSWCDPTVLRLTIPEVVPAAAEDAVPLVEAGFLAAIGKPLDANDEKAQHHRQVMLAHLALARKEHPNRARWLAELASSGPDWQREWVERVAHADATTSDAATPESDR